MFKSPSFIAGLAILSVAGALSAAPAAAKREPGSPAQFNFKVQVQNGETVYCSAKDTGHLLPSQGCLSKSRWAKQGVQIDENGGVLIASRDTRNTGKAEQRN